MIKTTQILFLLILVFNCASSQINLTDYAFLKKGTNATQVELIHPSFGSDSIITINELMMFPLIEERGNTCRLKYYNDSFDVDASVIVRYNNLSNQEKINKIFKTLKQLDSSYTLIKRVSINDSSIIVNTDTLESYSYNIDSIYFLVHEPIRDAIVNYWFKNRNHSVLEKWLLFIYRNPSGDDALDSKSLALCFLKYPKDFVQVFKQQPKSVRDILYDQIIRSSGFNLAAFVMKMNVNDSKQMFRRMMQQYE